MMPYRLEMRTTSLLLVKKSSGSIPNKQPSGLLHPLLQLTLILHLMNLLFTQPAADLPISLSSLPTSPIVLPPSRTHSMLTRSMTKNMTDSTSFLASKSSSLPSEPNSFAETFQDASWHAFMIEEFDALLTNFTWDLVLSPPSINLIGCKWIYKIKQKADGSLEHLKAPLMAQSYKQQ